MDYYQDQDMDMVGNYDDINSMDCGVPLVPPAEHLADQEASPKGHPQPDILGLWGSEIERVNGDTTLNTTPNAFCIGSSYGSRMEDKNRYMANQYNRSGYGTGDCYGGERQLVSRERTPRTTFTAGSMSVDTETSISMTMETEEQTGVRTQWNEPADFQVSCFRLGWVGSMSME